MSDAHDFQLGSLRDEPDAVLMLALSAASPVVRREAAELCGERQLRAATDLLIVALQDSNYGVSEAAAGALAILQEERAMPPLRQAYELSKIRNQGVGYNEWNCRHLWSMGLALGHFYSTDQLLEWFAVGDEDDRCIIVGLLTQREALSAVPLLRHTLQTASPKLGDVIRGSLERLAQCGSLI